MKFIVILTLLCVLIQLNIDTAAAWRRNQKKKICKYNGKRYKSGETFGEKYDSETNTCYISCCSSDGSVIMLDTPNCYPSPSPATTTPTRGCYHNGKFFVPGVTISSGRSDNWCFGSFCAESGHVIEWDNFDCGTSTTTPVTTTRPTTAPVTTTHPSTTERVKGCYHDGQFYPAGAEISSGEQSNWCFGMMCSEDGDILHWDNFKCFKTTVPPSTNGFTTKTRTPTTTESDRKRKLLTLIDILKNKNLY